MYVCVCRVHARQGLQHSHALLEVRHLRQTGVAELVPAAAHALPQAALRRGQRGPLAQPRVAPRGAGAQRAQRRLPLQRQRATPSEPQSSCRRPPQSGWHPFLHPRVP